jgi:hypothetical protein
MAAIMFARSAVMKIRRWLRGMFGCIAPPRKGVNWISPVQSPSAFRPRPDLYIGSKCEPIFSARV